MPRGVYDRKKKRKYVRKTQPESEALSKKVGFDLGSLVPEDGINVTLRTEETSQMYQKLDQLNVGQSYRLPMEFMRTFQNAKNSHRRNTSKIFIMRKLDKYNFRVWRMADHTVLRTARKKK